MTQTNILIGGFVATLVVVVVWLFTPLAPERVSLRSNVPRNEGAFARFGLVTDTDAASIPLEEVLFGGPGKDGIPALDHPTFVSISNAEVNDETLGVLVSVKGEERFYPYSILVWHEIANDSIEDMHFAVTFCPLCGSAIVFNRQVDGDILTFGVSGLLYESNLLMYDRKTESLWSQAGTEAVVGDYTGTRLDILPMHIISFAELKERHPGALVLSTNTGYARSYDVDPYTGYGLTDELYFPVSVSDERFSAKELMYVVPVGNLSVAFPVAELTDTDTFTAGTTTLTALRVPDGIVVTAGGERVPGYYEMWFSWATQHEDDGVVWRIR